MDVRRYYATFLPERVALPKDWKCAICLDEARDEAIISPCLHLLKQKTHLNQPIQNSHHFFHKNCLEDWAKRQPTCPLCKKQIEEVIVDAKSSRCTECSQRTKRIIERLFSKIYSPF